MSQEVKREKWRPYLVLFSTFAPFLPFYFLLEPTGFSGLTAVAFAIVIFGQIGLVIWLPDWLLWKAFPDKTE